MYNDGSLAEGPSSSAGPRHATRVDPGGAWLELLPHAPRPSCRNGRATIARRPLNTNQHLTESSALDALLSHGSPTDWTPSLPLLSQAQWATHPSRSAMLTPPGRRLEARMPLHCDTACYLATCNLWSQSRLHGSLLNHLIIGIPFTSRPLTGGRPWNKCLASCAYRRLPDHVSSPVPTAVPSPRLCLSHYNQAFSTSTLLAHLVSVYQITLDLLIFQITVYLPLLLQPAHQSH